MGIAQRAYCGDEASQYRPAWHLRPTVRPYRHVADLTAHPLYASKDEDQGSTFPKVNGFLKLAEFDRFRPSRPEAYFPQIFLSTLANEKYTYFLMYGLRAELFHSKHIGGRSRWFKMYTETVNPQIERALNQCRYFMMGRK